MNQTEAWRRLDEIERQDPDPSFDSGALGIMTELAETSNGLRLLVERYAGSPSAHIGGFLALVLSERANNSTSETAPLVFEFAAKLGRKDHEAALVSSLGAMQKQISFGAGWGDEPRPPSSLFPFLKHCVDCTGQRSILVHSAAVDLITTICLRGLLRTVFDVEQIEWIEAKLKPLMQTDSDLSEEIVQLEEYIAQEKLADQ